MAKKKEDESKFEHEMVLDQATLMRHLKVSHGNIFGSEVRLSFDENGLKVEWNKDKPDVPVPPVRPNQ